MSEKIKPVVVVATAKAKPVKAAPAKVTPQPKKVVTKTVVAKKVAPVVVPVKPEKPVKPVKLAKEVKPKKQKMVRDSFTMLQDDYAQIAAIKERCLKAGVSAKKSEVLRAALIYFAGLSDRALLNAIGKLPAIKTGRPAKAD